MKRKRQKMYAISLDGVGLVAGTLAYSRMSAIELLCVDRVAEWSACKAAGYRTVRALIEIIGRDGARRRDTRPNKRAGG
jgi:hypothetical protein